MRNKKLLIAGEFVVSVVFSFLSAALTILAFRSIGRGLYSAQGVSWIWAALPLSAAYGCTGPATWYASDAGVRASVVLRKSTLDHAVAVDPDRAGRLGAGYAQAISLDSELVGSLLVTSGPGAVLGLAQSAAGLAVLLRGPARAPELAVFLVSSLALIFLGAMLLRARSRWSEQRGTITNALIQRLLGLRTVSVQEDPAFSSAESARLARSYGKDSRSMDTWTFALAGSAFAIGAALLLVAALVNRPGPSMAVDIGAALLAGVGITKLCLGAVDGVNAINAYTRLGVLRSWRSPRVPGPVAAATALVVGEKLSYTYDSGTGLKGPTSLEVREGERVLLSGPSGCGKTTLAEIVSLRRAPTAGRLGLGEGVRVLRVPQSGDDYVFHGSVLFNVLCGKQWPPTEESASQAKEILAELGLGDLLSRMPSGLGQPVGEGGWRLSAGESARLSLARALVARPDVLIIDETIAPLDPVNRRRALRVAERYARAVIAIAHA